jgi:hypothetical protein
MNKHPLQKEKLQSLHMAEAKSTKTQKHKSQNPKLRRHESDTPHMHLREREKGRQKR